MTKYDCKTPSRMKVIPKTSWSLFCFNSNQLDYRGKTAENVKSLWPAIGEASCGHRALFFSSLWSACCSCTLPLTKYTEVSQSATSRASEYRNFPNIQIRIPNLLYAGCTPSDASSNFQEAHKVITVTLTVGAHLFSRKLDKFLTVFIHFHGFLGPLGYTVWMKAFIITTTIKLPQAYCDGLSGGLII